MEKLAPIISYLNSLRGRADLAQLEKLLHESQVTLSDVASLCKFGDKSYKRNLVSSSVWHDFLVICWKPGQQSPIHDHAGSSCAFKVVSGNASEKRYEKLKSAVVEDLVQQVHITNYATGHICSAQDTEIHKIENNSRSDNLVTLHIYSPPLKMNYFRESESETIFVPEELATVSNSAI